VSLCAEQRARSRVRIQSSTSALTR